ncbi:CHAT domain-containing protein [Hypoxylon sp. NC0597]|nr:CHAT domain-containing protein [Hypoxylon sp. NC0597]
MSGSGKYGKNDEDLDLIIEIRRDFVRDTPVDDLGRPDRLNALGTALSDRYNKLGDLADLDEALQHVQEAIALSPDTPHRISLLNNFASALNDRYVRTGALSDLEEAIRVGWEVVNSTPQNDPDLGEWLANLSIGLSDRYLRTGAVADLEESIRVARASLKAVSSDHVDRPLWLNNLSIRLGERYSLLENIADLKEAIVVGREAVDASRKHGLDLAKPLNNLGNRYGELYAKTGDTAAFEEALRLTRDSFMATPKDHPDRAIIQRNLGARFYDHYSKTEKGIYLIKAIKSRQLALRHPTASPDIRIDAGRLLVRDCAMAGYWRIAYDAASVALSLVSKLDLRSLEFSDAQYILGQIVGLASDAAAIALRVGADASTALNFLEQGRGVLAASLLDIRTDTIKSLEEDYPELAANFVRLRRAVELSFTSDDTSPHNTAESPWQTRGKVRHEAAVELDNLISEIRKKPGFESFLLAPTDDEIKAAAKKGPIVVVNVSAYRCDAILIETNSIQSINLHKLKLEDIQQRERTGSLWHPRVLSWLWDAVAGPILNSLQITKAPLNSGDYPRIWWIPTGALSRFPLHAAGYHGKGSDTTVIDRVMSSYSLSIKTIIDGRRLRSPATLTSRRAVLVAMPDTPEQKTLPFARDEVAMLDKFCRAMGLESTVPERRKKDVLSHISGCTIFHFAGHGDTDTNDPLQSHILLEDWQSDRLTVASLLETNIHDSRPFLAYLSACGTGQIRDEKSIDEGIHLINACQLAGFRHVIGTLWEVNDETCVDIARVTYEELKDGGLTDESVCRGLHKATMQLRDNELNSMKATRKRGNNSARSLDMSPVGYRESTMGTGRLPRDVLVYESDDEDDMPTSHWVPYVHHGI